MAALTQLSNTTLSAAIAAGDKTFSLASTTGITAGTSVIVVRNEVMKVQEVPVSGQVGVLRGYQGTAARAHPSGAIAYIGTPDQFKQVSLTAQQNGLVGDSGPLPDYMVPGQRAFDGAGNEFILVDLTFAAFTGVAVLIDRLGTFTAIALASGQAGTVGILTEEGTSNQYVWAQIYGFHTRAQFTSGSSLMTSTGIIQAATTVSTPAGGLLGRTTSQASSEATARIFGIYPTSAITTATTAATSSTGFTASVWLNYPFIERAMSS